VRCGAERYANAERGCNLIVRAVCNSVCCCSAGIVRSAAAAHAPIAPARTGGGGNSTPANIFCYESETVGITLNLAQTGTPYSARSGVQPPGHEYVAFKNRNYVSPLVYASVLMVNLDPELQGSGKIVHCEI